MTLNLGLINISHWVLNLWKWDVTHSPARYQRSCPGFPISSQQKDKSFRKKSKVWEKIASHSLHVKGPLDLSVWEFPLTLLEKAIVFKERREGSPCFPKERSISIIPAMSRVASAFLMAICGCLIELSLRTLEQLCPQGQPVLVLKTIPPLWDGVFISNDSPLTLVFKTQF